MGWNKPIYKESQNTKRINELHRCLDWIDSEDKLNFKIEYAYQSISGWEHADKNRNYNEITIKANKLIRELVSFHRLDNKFDILQKK